MNKKRYIKPSARQYSSFNIATGNCLTGVKPNNCDTGTNATGNPAACESGAQYNNIGCVPGQSNAMGCGVGTLAN